MDLTEKLSGDVADVAQKLYSCWCNFLFFFDDF